MIANARMYSVTPHVAALWRSLLGEIVSGTGLDVAVVDHAPPAAISELWRRPDKAAVFMCGLPYSLAAEQPEEVQDGLFIATDNDVVAYLDLIEGQG